MTGNTDRKGRILHWDDLFAEHADRAASRPISVIDRDLRAMDFDPAGVQQRLSTMDGAHALRAGGPTPPSRRRYPASP